MADRRTGRQPGSPRPQRIPSARSSSIPRIPSPLTTSTEEESNEHTAEAGYPSTHSGAQSPALTDDRPWRTHHRTSRFDQSPSTGLPTMQQLQRSRSGSPTGTQRSRSASPTGGQRSRSQPPQTPKVEMKASESITLKHADLAEIPFAQDDTIEAQVYRQRWLESSQFSHGIPGMANRTPGQTEAQTRLMINFLDHDIRQKKLWSADRSRDEREVIIRKRDRRTYPAFIGPSNFYFEMKRIIEEAQIFMLTASYCKEDREQKFAYDHLWCTAQKMKELRIIYNKCLVNRSPQFYIAISNVLACCNQAIEDPRRNVVVLAGIAQEIHKMTSELTEHLEPMRRKYEENESFRRVTNRADLVQRSAPDMNVLQTARSAMKPQPPHNFLQQKLQSRASPSSSQVQASSRTRLSGVSGARPASGSVPSTTLDPDSQVFHDDGQPQDQYPPRH